MIFPDGVFGLAPTPFDAEEDIDHAGLRQTLDFYLTSGCAGVAVLGFLGEALRLSECERRAVVTTSVEHVAGRAPVIVGIPAQSTRTAVSEAKSALSDGAAGLMLPPPARTSANESLSVHFRKIGDGAGLPIIIHDAPQTTGVRMPTSFLHRLLGDLPPGSAVKVEEPIPLDKQRRLDELRPGQAWGGLNGRYMPEEWRVGVRNWITGIPIPDVLSGVLKMLKDSAAADARTLHAAALPTILLESEPGTCLAMRKAMLRYRGVIATDIRRGPVDLPIDDTLGALRRALDTLLQTH